MPAPIAPTALYRFYRWATWALQPLAFSGIEKKLRAAQVPKDRVRERLGHATLPHPGAPVVWFHAASVGESLSVLTLITRLGERLPREAFLITSGTATSAELIARRMPPRTRHQFAPLDTPSAVDRFLAHWQPEAAIFVESEFWPQMLVRTRATGARLALLNARLSEGSVKAWRRFPATARFILDQFSLMLTQNEVSTANLMNMGADPSRVRTGINLKSTSAALPVDKVTLAALQDSLGPRRLWAASSTHPGEEEIALEAHRALLERFPDLCLLLIPRHPERGDAVEALVKEAGLNCARRTRGELPGPETQVYLADTLGETGTWYAAAPIVLLGGSLVPIGGHNPFEPAHAGAAILTGANIANFIESFEPLVTRGGAVEVGDAEDIARTVRVWLDNADALAAARTASRQFAAHQQSSIDEVIDDLIEALDLGHG